MWHLLIVAGSLTSLFGCGHVFLNKSLYNGFEEKDLAVQV